MPSETRNTAGKTTCLHKQYTSNSHVHTKAISLKQTSAIIMNRHLSFLIPISKGTSLIVLTTPCFYCIFFMRHLHPLLTKAKLLRSQNSNTFTKKRLRKEQLNLWDKHFPLY